MMRRASAFHIATIACAALLCAGATLGCNFDHARADWSSDPGWRQVAEGEYTRADLLAGRVSREPAAEPAEPAAPAEPEVRRFEPGTPRLEAVRMAPAASSSLVEPHVRGTVERRPSAFEVHERRPRAAAEISYSEPHGAYVAPRSGDIPLLGFRYRFKHDLPVAGVRISGVTSGRGLAEAGVRVGDVIIAVNDHTVRTGSDIRRILSFHQPGDVVQVRYWRNGISRDADVTLTARGD